MSNITGANKTPLGKYNPGFTGFQQASQASLLKPNYMGAGGPEDEQFQAYQPPPPPPPVLMQTPPQPIYQPAAPSIKREREFDNNSNDSNSQNNAKQPESREERRKKRKSRWGGSDAEKVVIPGMPTMLPSNLSPDQEKIYLLQLQIEENSRKLRTGDLNIPMNPEERSPSPEPIYNNEGKRLNTREFRTRKRLEDERHSLIQQMTQINPAYKPPADYKPPQQKISEKVLIPQEEYPDINFVGLLIGPRGNTLKSMEKDTGGKIIIRGKGSVKEGKIGRKDGQPMPGEDEPLHAFITASTQESVTKAVKRIKEVIRQGIEVPENQNDLRRNQLRELALLNGTLRESDGPRCSNCGSNAHRSWQCPDKTNVTNNVVCSNCNGTGHIARDCKEKKPATGSVNSTKIDEEYLSLMAELGQGPPPVKNMGSSYGSSSGGAGYSGMTTKAQTPMALAGPSPSSTSSGHSSHGHMSGSDNQGGGSWRREQQPVAQPQQAYWQQQQQTPTAYAAAYDPAAYAQLYQSQASATWMQNAWAQAMPAAGVATPPPPPPSTAQPVNPWAAYMGAGVPAPPPPPPPPLSNSALSAVLQPPPPPPPPM